MFTSIDKALVGAVGSISFLGNFFGLFTVSPEVQASVAAALPVLIWLIPNKRKA